MYVRSYVALTKYLASYMLIMEQLAIVMSIL